MMIIILILCLPVLLHSLFKFNKYTKEFINREREFNKKMLDDIQRVRKLIEEHGNIKQK